MNNEQKMVKDFHDKYHCVSNMRPTMIDVKTLFLRARLISEEAAEFLTAAQTENMEQMADSLCDLLVVVYGTAVTLGIDLEPLFAEVHRSNMTKDGGGKDIGGKVIKGPNYEPPQLDFLIKKQSEQEKYWM